MKQSVKLRITGLITLLMACLSVILMIALVSYTHRIAHNSISNHLERLMRNNLEAMEVAGKKFIPHSDFLFSQDGANVLVYNRKGALLAGQIPGSFTLDVPFENGIERVVDGGQAEYVMLDVLYPTGWDDGVWIRIIHEAPDYLDSSVGLIVVLGVGIPIFLIIAAAGTYMIIQTSLKPLDNIASTASSINDASDLSLRIGAVGEGDEFTRVAEVFDRLLERLEALFESEKKFAQDASHELRTPITVIKGACDYGLRFDDTKEEFTETLTVIDRQIIKMMDIVEQLLRITRLEHGLDIGDLETVDLGILIKDSVFEGNYDLDKIRMDLPEGIMARVEPLLISRLSDNLISNAFRYGKGEDTRICLELKETDKEIIYSVSDNGEGIDPEELGDIWQRFYRSSKKKNAEGTGLGLSFVQQISRVHGGYMEVDSSPGEGSCFSLHLPLGAR